MTRVAWQTAVAVVAMMATTDHGLPLDQAAPITTIPVRSARATDVAAGAGVETEMRQVDFQIDSGIVLRIARLRGTLVATKPGTPATFDDKQSFAIVMHSADITIDTASLGILLNRHVFGYKGAPLRKIRVGTDGDQLVQSGVLRKGISMPFRIRANVSLMPDGRIRLHPTSVKVLGVGVTNVMKFFGIELDGVIKLQSGHGASVDGNDIILDPLEILPPPRIRGRLTSIAVAPGMVRQTFGPAPGQDERPLRTPDRATPNYMYFRHGTLRFGKLTMADADLLIVDSDPSDIFQFWLDRYNEQLVAGYSKSTASLGLVVHMPDYRSSGRKDSASVGIPAKPRGS